MSKRLGGIIGCKYKTSSWHLNGFPYVMVVTLGQQYNIGEKPTVILYTKSYINRHAGTPEKEGFNDWGGQEYDDFVPGEVTKTAPSGDETT